MKKTLTGKRVAIEAVILLLLHYFLIYLMDYYNVIEKILCPGSGVIGTLTIAIMFIFLRVFVIIFAPGWFTVRLLTVITFNPKQISALDINNDNKKRSLVTNDIN